MPDTLDPAQHVKPYVHEGRGYKALHFSISEIQSRMALADPDALTLAYTRLMMGFLLLKPAPRRIAMVGLGGGSLVKFCHRHLPDARIEVAEVNPHVLALRQDFHIPPDDERLAINQADGAAFVRHLAEPVDVLMVDAFTSEGMPPRLGAQRFYDDCHAALLDEGLLVVNLHEGHRHFDAYVGRIQRSFDDAVLVVGDGDLSNSVVFACRGKLLDRSRTGVLRRPRDLPPAAAAQLADAFTRVSRALLTRRRGGASPT
jgi:spermidine synthase